MTVFGISLQMITIGKDFVLISMKAISHRLPCFCGYRYRLADNGGSCFREAILDRKWRDWSTRNNVLLLCGQLRIIKKRYARERSGVIMAKSANLYARIEPEIKEQAEKILSTLGISASNAINMFYKQIILQRGLPFEVKIPERTPTDISMLGTEALHAELEKGYADMKAGRTKDAKTVFADIRKDYGL